MQVATLSPAPVRLADYKPKAVTPAPAPKLAPAVQSILQHIASSTKLSHAEKQSFMQMLADIEKFGNGDPKLLIKLMQLIAMVEQLHADEEFQQDLLKDITEQYLAIRDGGTQDAAKANTVDIVT